MRKTQEYYKSLVNTHYWFLIIKGIYKNKKYKTHRLAQVECACWNTKDIRLDKLLSNRIKTCWCNYTF